MSQVLTKRLASEFALYVLSTGVLIFLFLPLNFRTFEKIVSGNICNLSLDVVLLS